MGAWVNKDRTEEARAFLREYEALCAKHGIKVGVWATYDDNGLELEHHDPATPLPKGERDLPHHETEGAIYVHTYDPTAPYPPRRS